MSEMTANNYSPLGIVLMNGPVVDKSTVFLIDGQNHRAGVSEVFV